MIFTYSTLCSLMVIQWKKGSLLTPHLQSLCFFLLLVTFYKQHSFLLNNWTASVPAIFPIQRRWRASREGASLCRGIWMGGRACLLAMRVSRSVRLRVCEAVIRFQDFPSVTGLLTKPYTPLHEEPPPPDTPAPCLPPLGCYTSAGSSHSHLQPHPTLKVLISYFSASGVNVKYMDDFFLLSSRVLPHYTLVVLSPSFSLAHFSFSISASSVPPPHSLSLGWQVRQWAVRTQRR